MKNILKYIIPTVATAALLCGCTDFLDRDPDTGNSSEDVFSEYISAQAFLDRALFELPRHFTIDFENNNRSHNSQLSDECATTANAGASGAGQYRAAFINSGSWLLSNKNTGEWEMGVNVGGKAIASRAATSLRVCNLLLENLHMVQAEPQQIDLLRGQALMLRAWWYFELMRRYGGMPIMDHVFVSLTDADRPRETYQGSHGWMVQGLDEAIGLLPDEWNDADVGRPNKIAAMALRSMVELYAASPLMQNDLETTEIKPYNKERAANAAKLAQKVIDYVNEHQDLYRLIGKDGDDFLSEYVYYFPQALSGRNPEHLWYNRRNNDLTGTGGMRTFCLTAQGTSAATGENSAMLPTPTLNMVNMFDKKGADGVYYPIVDSRAGYTLDNPYQDRDPRFYKFILYPGGGPWGQHAVGTAGRHGYTAAANAPYYPTTFVGGYDYNTFLDNQFTRIQSVMQTSFMHRKFHWEQATENSNSAMRANNCHLRTIFIRVAQIYLDFAEASFEATGSATQIVDGCSMNAQQAINIVRERWGLTPLASDIVGDATKFREAYRRERAVELFMENHRWFDIRRWMIAHEIFNPTGPIYGVSGQVSGTNAAIWGMRTELKPGQNINTSADISWDKFTYTPYPMTNVVRVFAMRNYWYPFPSLEIASQKNLKQNPGW